MRRLRGSPGKGFCEVLAVWGRRRGMGQTRVGDRGGAVASVVVSKRSGSNDVPTEAGWQHSVERAGIGFRRRNTRDGADGVVTGGYRFGSQKGLNQGAWCGPCSQGGSAEAEGIATNPRTREPGNETR